MDNKLKIERIKRGYTQEYMAKELGYKDKSGYNHLENGNVKLTLEQAIKISEILKVDMDIFLPNKFKKLKHKRKRNE